MANFRDLSGNNLNGVVLNEQILGDSPSKRSLDITPHNTNPVPNGRGLWVGVGGDITGQLVDDSAVDQVFTLAGGMAHPISFKYIRATGTTATGLKVLF